MLSSSINENNLLVSLYKDMPANGTLRYEQTIDTLHPGAHIFYNRSSKPREYCNRSIIEICTHVMMNYIFRETASIKKKKKKEKIREIREVAENWTYLGVVTYVENFTQTSTRVYEIKVTLGGSFNSAILPDPTILQHGNRVRMGLYVFKYLKNETISSPYKDSHSVLKTDFYKDDTEIPQYVFYTNNKQLNGLDIFTLSDHQPIDIEIGIYFNNKTFGVVTKDVPVTNEYIKIFQQKAKQYSYDIFPRGYQFFCKFD